MNRPGFSKHFRWAMHGSCEQKPGFGDAHNRCTFSPVCPQNSAPINFECVLFRVISQIMLTGGCRHIAPHVSASLKEIPTQCVSSTTINDEFSPEYVSRVGSHLKEIELPPGARGKGTEQLPAIGDYQRKNR